MPLFMFVAMSNVQAASLGQVLRREWYGNGSSIPFKLDMNHAIANLLESEPGKDLPLAEVTVIRVSIAEDDLGMQMAGGKVKWGNWDNRPGLRWYADFQLVNWSTFNPHARLAVGDTPVALSSMICTELVVPMIDDR